MDGINCIIIEIRRKYGRLLLESESDALLLEEPRKVLKHKITYELTEAGRKNGVKLDNRLSSLLDTGNGDLAHGVMAIVKKFVRTFREQIFVSDNVYVSVKTIDKPFAEISHQMYNPVGCVCTPLAASEPTEALWTFIDEVNDNRGYHNDA